MPLLKKTNIIGNITNTYRLVTSISPPILDKTPTNLINVPAILKHNKRGHYNLSIYYTDSTLQEKYYYYK